MSNMFVNTTNLNVVYVGADWTTEKADISNMFGNSKIKNVTQK